MKKFDLGQWLAIIANFGVIIGIAFLAYEMRQNTIAISGTTVQAISDQSLQAVLIALEVPELQLAWQRGGLGVDYMTPEDRSVLNWWFTGAMRITENRFRQADLGTVNANIVRQLGGASATYKHPYFREFWLISRQGYAEDFANWVDENLIPLVEESFVGTPMDNLLPEVQDAARQLR